MAPRLRIGLRRAIGLIAAYALVLQATLASALLAQAAANPAVGFDPLSAICVIDGGKAHAGLPDPGADDSGHAGKLGNHCGLCAVSAPVLAALIAVVVDQLAPSRSHLAGAANDQVENFTPTSHPGRPRGPPTIA